jgi:hypothetical protein
VKIATAKDRDRWLDFVRGQPLPIDVNCEPWAEPRSLAQNAFLWAAVYAPLVERAGFSAEEWHELFCIRHFGGVDHVKPDGRIETRPLRTTTRNEHGKRDVLKGKPFRDFVTFVESECASRGVFVTQEYAGP